MTDRFNTIAGWTLFSLIIGWGLTSVSERVFHADKPHVEGKPGYFIEGAAEGGGAAEGPPLATLLASASPDAGEATFAKCMACHSIAQGGANGIGPNLWAVVGEPIGKGKAGFAFSSSLAEKGGEWTYDALNEWLKSPRAFASGTKMSFAGLSSAEDRANVIMYLHKMGGGPPLPAAPAEAAAPAADAAAGADGGPGAPEGAPVAPVEAAGGAGAPQPAASANAATAN